MNKLILGIDAGNYEGKTAGLYGVDAWYTNISASKERKVIEVFGEDDMEFVVNGRKGIAGSIAKYESRFGSKGMYGASKAHWYTEVRVLLSIYRYAVKYGVSANNVSIVVGQPYVVHTDALKAELKSMLQKSHAITVNGENMTINIEEVGVAPEGVGAFWGNTQENGTCKVVDVGSGTVNAISFEDYRVTNYNSNTLNYGTEVITEMDELAIGIIQDTTALGWSSADRVLICGGSATEMLPHLQAHYGKAVLLSAQPKYANAVGFYTLANGSFR